ncbi:MAG: ankyrin repeat domain-containing protein [Candidatus Aquirickettsiella sp.]
MPKKILSEKLNRRLERAFRSNAFTKVNSLLKRGADINGLSDELKLKIKEDFLNPGLVLAFNEKNIKNMEFFLQQGADVNSLDEHGEPLLGVALDYNYASSIKLLLENGVDVNVRSIDQETMLEKALRLHNKNMIESLLKKGANPNTPTSHDDTHLFYAINKKSNEKQEIICLLLKYGADIHYRHDPTSQTTLEEMFYSSDRNDEIIEFLIKNKLLKDIDASLPHAENNPDLSDVYEDIQIESKNLQQIKAPAQAYSAWDLVKETNFNELIRKLGPNTTQYLKTMENIAVDDLDYFKAEFKTNLDSLHKNIMDKEYRDWAKKCIFVSRGKKPISLNEDVQAKLVSYLTLDDLIKLKQMIREDREKAKQENTIENTKDLVSTNTSRLAASLLFLTPQNEEQNEEQKEVNATKISIQTKRF